jgi:hypothetical protein
LSSVERLEASTNRATAARHDETVQDRITVGEWNIEWLGKPQNRSGISKNVAQSPTDIANYIKLSEVQLLSLEEICDDQQDDILNNSTLDDVMGKLNATPENDWSYALCPKRKASDTSQCVGFAWNKRRVNIVGDILDIPVPDDPDAVWIWDRGMHAGKFSFGTGKTDVVVVPIHMKANVGGVNKARLQRVKEAKALVKSLSLVRQEFSDKDVVIMGDSNILSSSEPAEKAFADADFVDLNEGDNPTTFHGAAAFDRIFVTADQPEFKNTDLWIMEADNPAEHKKSLSDHYMVVTVLPIAADDD